MRLKMLPQNGSLHVLKYRITHKFDWQCCSTVAEPVKFQNDLTTPKLKSRSFEILQDLLLNRLALWWLEALGPIDCVHRHLCSGI